MAINILIGIGGTGAKIVESALYLLAAGVGPDDTVHVGLIDQDNSNGNVERTETLLNLICEIQKELANGQNRLDWVNAREAERTALFSIRLRKLFHDKDKAHWRPAPENLPDLRAILQRDDAPEGQKALFDLLFRPVGAAEHEKEQDLNLAEGYRGRAHVGSAALLSALHHDSPDFLKAMTELLKNGSTAGNEVRIMLVGSLFGGTGAAGFPTIARSLHNMRQPDNDHDIRGEKVHIGGVLMLPYFGFRDPAAKENVITTSQLLPQARVAVNYYNRLLEQEVVFDHLYISGWDEMTNLNYHEPGRKEQCNPALLPELLAALAVKDFFVAPKITAKPRPMMAARRERETFGWTDLPIEESRRQTAIDRIAQALRFAYAWRYTAEPGIDDREKTGILGIGGKEQIRSEWIRRHTANTQWDSATDSLRKNIGVFAGSLLNWATNLRLFATMDNVRLWDTGRVTARMDKNRPQDPVTLQERRSDEVRNDDLTTLVAPTSAATPADGAAIYNALKAETRHGESTGLGRLIAAVYRAARLHHNAEAANAQ